MPKTQTIAVDITKCVRCGKDHKRLVFKTFKTITTEYKFWAMCPNTQEPILMAQVRASDPRAVDLLMRGHTCVKSK